MRKILLLAAVVLMVIAGAPSAVRAQTGGPEVHGYFTLTGYVPAALKNIDHINILIPPYVDPARPNAPDHGRIRTTGRYQADYLLLKPTLYGKNVSFRTRTVRGVRYEFSGTLTRTSFDEPQPTSEEIILRGTLKKVRRGRTVARTRVACTWELGD